MKKQEIKRNSPCGKPAREKTFELHTVSEIILEVVRNMIWRFIMAVSAGSISRMSRHNLRPLFFFKYIFSKLYTPNQDFSNRAAIEGYEAWLEWVMFGILSKTLHRHVFIYLYISETYAIAYR